MFQLDDSLYSVFGILYDSPLTAHRSSLIGHISPLFNVRFLLVYAAYRRYPESPISSTNPDNPAAGA
jgi:hypothetical protein